jgi:predicted metal-binding membrane protein
MTEPRSNGRRGGLEAVLKRDQLVVKTMLVIVIAASWIFLLLGAGTGMLPHEMAVLVPDEMATDRAENAMLGMAGISGDEAMPMQGDGASMSGTEDKSDMQEVVATPIDAGSMGMMDMAMTPAVWTPGYALLMFWMWWLMMIAMMLPSAAPMVLLHATVTRKGLPDAHPDASPPRIHSASTAFLFGYLGMWAAFSVVAVAAQWALERANLLSEMMMPTNKILGASLLLAAGVWQLTPFKTACLRHCRAPLQFLSENWRAGVKGALNMGLKHGAFCLGCCWFLMALLFFGGVMNLVWIIGLAAFVLLEKVVPAGVAFGRITGVLLIAWGLRLGFSAF